MNAINDKLRATDWQAGQQDNKSTSHVSASVSSSASDAVRGEAKPTPSLYIAMMTLAWKWKVAQRHFEQRDKVTIK